MTIETGLITWHFLRIHDLYIVILVRDIFYVIFVVRDFVCVRDFLLCVTFVVRDFSLSL